MKDLWNRLIHLADTHWSRVKTRGTEQRLHETAINLAIERVVDQVNPRLRALGGYRKQLFPVVERALEYAQELSQQVPGPILVNRKTWSTDPTVNALFGSGKRLRWVLTGPDVRKYIKTHPGASDCFAVLAAMPDVKSQLGIELVGETLQKDVRQTAVSFSNHEVALTGESEHEVRQILAHDALELLVSLAVQDIVEQESRIAEVEKRLRIVRLKQRAASTRSRGVEFLLDGGVEHNREQEALKDRIAELERDLSATKAGLETLGDHLDRLVALLERPETHLGLERVRARLDRMNILREGEDESTGTEIEFTRVRRGDTPVRVVALIRFPRSELLEDGERLREAERSLG